MKKLMVFGSSFIILIILISFGSAVRVNEVMAKTSSNVYGSNCEWIELYTDSPINLTDWTIDTDDGQDTNFNYYLEDFLIITKNKTAFLSNWNVEENKIIEWIGMGLADSGDNVSLFDNSSNLVSNFAYFDSDDSLSLQFCSNSWIENEPTPGSTNNCTTGNSCTPDCTDKECGDDGCGGNCGNCGSGEICENGECNDNEELYLELEWDEDEIINGEEFDIEVKAYNLEDEDYDIKVYIYDDEDNIISETYHEDDDRWRSSEYYVDEIFSGSGDKSETFSLRIDEDYEDFRGGAEIGAKIRKTGTSQIIDEITEDIEILEKEEDDEADDTNENDEEQENQEKTTTTVTQTGNVIRLGNKKGETENNEDKKQGNILYESGSEKVKKYAIYCFSLILIAVVIILIKKKF